MNENIPRIAVHFPLQIKTTREAAQGLLEYAQRHGPWAVRMMREDLTRREVNELRKWGCQGVIGSFLPRELELLDASLNIPVIASDPDSVRLGGLRHPGNFIGFIVCDNAPIGTAAAEFFLSKGLEEFAFIETAEPQRWSIARYQAFAKRLEASGHGCRRYLPSANAGGSGYSSEAKALSAWLRELPSRCGVFVANDERAQQVIDLCRGCGRSVPAELSILACDDDELICETTNPPLSSIKMSPSRAGYAAGELFDRYFRGESPEGGYPVNLTYTFDSIVSRLSTADLRVNDPLVERALVLIHINANRDGALSVAGLAAQLNVSKRLLELRFRSSLGRTVYDEIIDARLEQVTRALRAGTESIERLAERFGFSSASHLSRLFKRRHGTTPLRYRNAGRA